MSRAATPMPHIIPPHTSYHACGAFRDHLNAPAGRTHKVSNRRPSARTAGPAVNPYRALSSRDPGSAACPHGVGRVDAHFSYNGRETAKLKTF
jgi:hypothetical protein